MLIGLLANAEAAGLAGEMSDVAGVVMLMVIKVVLPPGA